MKKEGVQLNPLTHEYGTVHSNEQDLEVSDVAHTEGGDASVEFGDRQTTNLTMTVMDLESNPGVNSKYSQSMCGSVCGNNMSIIANTINALLGVSIFAMPWGFEQAGLVGGALTICLVAPLSYETARVLLVAQRMIYHSTGVVKNYPEIASDILGKNWSMVVKTATVISCLGGCVGYLIFLGEVCGQLFDLPLETAIQGAVIPLMLLSWIRSFRDLAIFTLIGVFAIIISCVVVMIDGVHAMQSQLPDPAHPQLISFRSAPNFLGPATFLYTIHYCVLSMGAETLTQIEANPGSSGAMTVTSSPTERRKATTNNSVDTSISRPLAISYAISSFLIIIVGSSGYFTYGAAAIVRDNEGNPQPGCENHVCQNIIMNLSPGPLRDFAGFSLVVAIVLSYCIILIPAREHIETFFLRHFEAESWTSESLQSYFINFIRSSLVLATALVAVLAPYFGTVLGSVGGLTDALQSFVLPPLIALKLLHHRGPLTQYFYKGIIVWGMATILYTIFKTARSIYLTQWEFMI